MKEKVKKVNKTPVIIRAFGTAAPKLGKWPQQIPETTSEPYSEKHD